MTFVFVRILRKVEAVKTQRLLRGERFSNGQVGVMLQPIVELHRFPAFSKLPHAVAADARYLWVSSRETRRIDVIERDAFVKVAEIDPPGMPWGMTYGDGQLVMTCGEEPDDTRRIRRYTMGSGFATGFVACPDDTGSHLAIHDGRVLLGQWYNRELLLLREDGTVERTYTTPHGIAGVSVVDGIACVLGTDDEDDGEYWLTRIDLGDSAAQPQDIATVPFRARGLAWDGHRWWTNHREADQIVAFVFPS